MPNDNLIIERAAVAVTEQSLLRAGLFIATPLVDEGIDLLAFESNPLRVLAVQVKGIGAGKGLTVYRKYATNPNLVVVYVLDPLGPTPESFVFTGSEAWALPADYRRETIRQGLTPGASDHHKSNSTYRWGNGVPKLLGEMLRGRVAGVGPGYSADPVRWRNLFAQFAI